MYIICMYMYIINMYIKISKPIVLRCVSAGLAQNYCFSHS